MTHSHKAEGFKPPSGDPPKGADNFIDAQRLARAGAATVLAPGKVTSGRLRDPVCLVLGDPSYAAAARQLATELSAMPAPEEVAKAQKSRFGGWSRPT